MLLVLTQSLEDKIIDGMSFVELFLVLASAPYFFWFSLPQNRMPRNPILDLACQSDNLDKGTLGPEMFLHVFDFFSGACCSAGSGPAGAFDGLWHPKAEQIQSTTSKTLGSVCFTWKVKETPMKMERKKPTRCDMFSAPAPAPPAPHAVAPKPSMGLRLCGIQKPSKST